MAQSKIVVKHVREVDNFLRKHIIAGKDLSDEKDRSAVIKDFLKTRTTTLGAMTPELFAFFLQKINTHALFEQMDNEDYTIVFPTYVPFDVVAVAAEYGFPDIYSKIEDNLTKKSRSVATTKTASAAAIELGGSPYLDKVASAEPSTATDREALEDLRDEVHFAKLAELSRLKTQARDMWWTFSNLEDLTKTAMFSANPGYRNLISDFKNSSIRGNKDKRAHLSDFNRFITILDEIIASDIK